MNTWRWIFAVAVLVGFASGPQVLDSAAVARPPIRWGDIPFAFAGSLVGGLFVVGMQLLRQDPRPSRWALRFFGPTAAYLVASGLSAALIAAATTGFAPHSLFFLAVGGGLLAGVLLCQAMFRRKFGGAL